MMVTFPPNQWREPMKSALTLILLSALAISPVFADDGNVPS
nr:MAG TPA: hypothetical protein [Caudoviricetes sp.]